MKKLLKQHWDVEFGGNYGCASSGSSYAHVNRAFESEDDFQVKKPEIITKISVKICSTNKGAHKFYLMTFSDNKIFYVSDAITPIQEYNYNLFEIETNIPVLPEMGGFGVAYSPVSGSLNAFTSVIPDDVKLGIHFVDRPGAATATVGSTVELRENKPHRECFFGVMLELDDGESENNGNDCCDCHCGFIPIVMCKNKCFDFEKLLKSCCQCCDKKED